MNDLRRRLTVLLVLGVCLGMSSAATAATPAVPSGPGSGQAPVVVTAAPDAPPITNAWRSSDTSMTVTWAPPANTGSSPINAYIVGRPDMSDPVWLTPDARQHTFTDMVPGQTYVIWVAAHNSTGASAPTYRDWTQPSLVPQPGTPAAVSATYDHATQAITVTWQPPANATAAQVTSYEVGVDNVNYASPPAEARQAVLTRGGGFAEGDRVVYVFARNSTGFGPAAETTVRVVHALPPTEPPPTTPPPPTTTPEPQPGTVRPDAMFRPRVVVRGRKVVIRWKPPAQTNGPLTGYRVDFFTGKTRKAKPGARKLVIRRHKRLVNWVRITAVNANGRGELSRWRKFRVR